MEIIEIRQPFLEGFDDKRTDVYIKNVRDQRELREWCTEMFGDYRLCYSRSELDEPQGCQIFIFEDMEQAMAFKVRFAV